MMDKTFCIGKTPDGQNCTAESLYCYDHAARIGNAELREELAEVKWERNELREANGLIKYHFDKWADYQIDDEIFAANVLDIFAALERGQV